jgi:hypothetical protein
MTGADGAVHRRISGAAFCFWRRKAEGTMRQASSARGWWRLPSRIALLLGLGALSVAGARAATTPAQPGETLVRAAGGSIYLSEGGGAFEELSLADTAQARLLRQLLEGQGTAASESGLRLHPTILAGAGGAGFHGLPTAPAGASSRTPPADAGGSAMTAPARDRGISRKAKTGRNQETG